MSSTIIENIYLDILEISDKEKQKEYWLGLNQDHASSYNEVMCRLFDDNDLNGFLVKSVFEFGFTNALISELIVLRDKLSYYEEKDDDTKILMDPKWDEVINQAKKVITLWNKQK